VILFAHYSDSISSKSNHLPSSPTSITRAPPSKDVGRVRKRSSTPLKQHGRRPRLPLPSPSTPPRHSTSSVENASPGLLPPSSPLPRHLTLSVEDAFPRFAITLAPSALPRHDVKRRGCLPWSAVTLLSATSLDVERRGCLARLPLSFHPPLCYVTRRRASRTPPVCDRPPFYHITWHPALRTPPPACHCPVKSPAMPRHAS